MKFIILECRVVNRTVLVAGRQRLRRGRYCHFFSLIRCTVYFILLFNKSQNLYPDHSDTSMLRGTIRAGEDTWQGSNGPGETGDSCRHQEKICNQNYQ